MNYNTMRASRASAARESVSQRPAHLDELCAIVEAGGSYVEMQAARDGEDSGLDDEDARWSRRGRAQSWTDRPDEESSDMFRELEVARIQADHLHRQVRSTFAEVELHKRHASEFKALLEGAEDELSRAHEQLSRREKDYNHLVHKLSCAGISLREDGVLQGVNKLPMANHRPVMARRGVWQTLFRLAGGCCCWQSPKPPEGAMMLSPSPPLLRQSSSSSSKLLAGRLSGKSSVGLHDVGVQTDQPLAGAAEGSPSTNPKLSSFSTVAVMAMQHAKELQSVHQELAQRLEAKPPMDLVMERRPERQALQLVHRELVRKVSDKNLSRAASDKTLSDGGTINAQPSPGPSPDMLPTNADERVQKEATMVATVL